jgi:SAM-dependent methyltransferase
VLRGIPRMAPSAMPEEQRETADAFGYEWQHFDAVHDTYEQQFLEWVDPLRPADFKDRLVLDAGCGMGRHTRITAGFGTHATIGIDLSEAVEAAYRNTSHLPNTHIVQADINRLPFKAPFDLIYSVGVLHHTPDPAQSFSSLVGHLREGGRIAAWVYGAEGNFLVARVLTPFREVVTARLPRPALHAVSWVPAAIAYPILKTVFKGLKTRPGLLKRVERVPYVEYFCYLSDFGLDQLHSIVFDHLAPTLAFYLTRRDMETWVARNGLTQPSIAWHKRYSWRLLGTKPASADSTAESRTLATASA